MQVPWEWDDWAEIEFMGGSSFRTFSDHTRPPKDYLRVGSIGGFCQGKAKGSSMC